MLEPGDCLKEETGPDPRKFPGGEITRIKDQICGAAAMIHQVTFVTSMTKAMKQLGDSSLYN
jgi:hypothetical protein